MADEIKDIIAAVVRERLADAKILDVQVQEDEDGAGEAVYRIMVVYDNASGRVDAAKASGLARHTRSRLGEKNNFSFPIFRFVSQSDAKKLKAAAA